MKGDKLKYKNRQLFELAELQQPSSQYIDAGRVAYDAIFESLRQHPGLSVDRVRVAGSIGKGSALGDEFCPDFDLVVFLNEEKPPFSTKVIGHFAEAVTNAKVQTGARIIKTGTTQFSVQAKATVNGIVIELDVLPAANFVAGHDGDIVAAMGHVKIQEIETRREIKWRNKKFKDGYHLSSSLAEATVSYIYKLPPQISKLIRIAKYWDKHVNLAVRLSGRSYMIELVALGVNINRKCSRGLQARFSRFLEQMASLDTACIYFEDNYPLSEIPTDVVIDSRDRKSRLPIIMDPINPNNNLGLQFAEPEVKPALQTYKIAAQETLRRIRACAHCDDYLNINTWFRP